MTLRPQQRLPHLQISQIIIMITTLSRELERQQRLQLHARQQLRQPTKILRLVLRRLRQQRRHEVLRMFPAVPLKRSEKSQDLRVALK